METLRWTSAVTIVLLAQLVYAEKPCFSVGFGEAESNVCMCTSGYCDDIIREPPLFGSFVTYVSSEGGLRFEKTVGSLETFYYQHPDNSCPARDGCIPSTYLDPSTTYQTIEGFGGAVTDAAGINWRSLRSARLQQHLIESYFGDRGLEYNMIRTPIGGCDFSTHPYAYNEVPVNDAKLSNFTLSKEDYDYKLPMIKRAIKAAGKREVHIVATSWSPPPWMKSNNAFVGTSTLKEEYYQTYADYHLRFLEAFSKEGVPVWGITTTNEPSNAVIEDNFPINSMGWQVTAQGKWIANNLGPTIRDSNFQDTKIICNDDQRHHIIDYFNTLTRFVPEALPYIDGVATHFYLDPEISPEVLKTALKDHPDKFLMSTEACTGANTNEDRGVVLGSWERAQRYINSIIEYMNYKAAGWIDWNLCLDEQGGPNWSNNFVDSPIIVSDDGQKFYKQPMYYALGHVSKFVPRGSKRIHVDTLCENDSVTRTAFLTPDDNLVTVLHNSGEATDYFLVTCNRMVKLQLDEKSITTVEFPREECTNAVAF